MDDSGLSFFDDPEFNFAKDDKNEQDIKNKLSFDFFASEVLEDTELTGYVYVGIPKCLRAGSIFLRLETTEELYLFKQEQDYHLRDQLVVIREKIMNEMTLTEHSAKQSYSKDKKNMVVPISLKPIPPSSDNLILNKDDDKGTPVQTSYTKCILDVEAFVLDYEISKSTVLVLPFRIQLRGKLNKSCDLVIDTTPYISNGKKKHIQPIKKISLDNKGEVNLKKILNNSRHPDHQQHIKIRHKFTAYYATKNDIHNFNQVQIDLSEEEKNKIRYEALHKSDYFMTSMKDFRIVPNFRQISYKKHSRRGDASISHENPFILCCSKKTKFAINICLDLINLRNQDTSLNFVMSFDKRIVEAYLSLDVVIYSRLTHTGDEEDIQYFTENTCMLQGFDLDDKKMPRNNINNKLEFVQKLDLTPIQGKYQTVSSDHVKLEYFIKFYLSSLKYRLDLEVLEIPLHFFRIANEFSSQDNEEIANKFLKVKDRIEDTKVGVMLPYALIDFNLNVKGNGIVIEDDEYVDHEQFN